MQRLGSVTFPKLYGVLTMPNVNDWKRLHGTFRPDPTKQVESVDLEIHADDAVVRDKSNKDTPLYFTDLQFQPGNQLTGWVPNESEMMAPLTFTSDEWVNIPKKTSSQDNIQPSIKPQAYPNLESRMFNIVGRGHSTITLPNYYPESWDTEILPSGVDFTIYPKEDFKIARISSSVGVLLPDGDRDDGEPWRRYASYVTKDPENAEFWTEHPLHYRYTREFWIDGGKAGTEIKIHASTRSYKVNGTEIPTAGVDRFYIPNEEGGYNPDWNVPINRMRYLLAPRGSIRFRIEFYTQVEGYGGNIGTDWTLQDTGVGFHGTAEFKQWTYGKEQI